MPFSGRLKMLRRKRGKRGKRRRERITQGEITVTEELRTLSTEEGPKIRAN